VSYCDVYFRTICVDWWRKGGRDWWGWCWPAAPGTRHSGQGGHHCPAEQPPLQQQRALQTRRARAQYRMHHCIYSTPELVFTKLTLQIFSIGFPKLLFTVASLYWIYPLV
jgi:hypothetical protein